MSEHKPVYVIAEQMPVILEFGFDPVDDVTEFVTDAMNRSLVIQLRETDGESRLIVNFGHLQHVAVMTNDEVIRDTPVEDRRPILPLDLSAARRSAG